MRPIPIVILAAILGGCGRNEARRVEAAPPAPVSVGVSAASPQEWPAVYEATGTVRARATAVVSSKVMGYVQQVNARVGDRVSEGQALITLDARELEANLRRAEAGQAEAQSAVPEVEQGIAAAKANLDLAQATFRRVEDLYGKKSVSNQEFDEASARLKAAQATHEMAVAKRAQVQARIAQAAEEQRAARITRDHASIAAPLQQATRTVPIVFVNVTDPVAAGIVANLARPGGNATGFMTFEYSIGAKWLELIKQIAPRVNQVAVIRDPAQGSGTSQLAAMQAVAPSFAMEVRPVGVRDASEIESAIREFARGPNGALVVTSGTLPLIHRDLIVTLAARHRLPAVYPLRVFVTAGGLICYGADNVDQLRQAAGYVNRILKGEKPADLPVQAPTKFELVINLKTAKELGLDIPPFLQQRADEVIE